MPSWSDDDGKYWWNQPPEGPGYTGSIEIPHPPVWVHDGCKCAFCNYWNEQDRD